ncbi:MAG: alpha/beta fold hydrolase [Candidatus Shapirobacteria bacterium]|nr:alpha/beta fold hydrolase [Candidatus Shapirobacteria bacterium]
MNKSKLFIILVIFIGLGIGAGYFYKNGQFKILNNSINNNQTSNNQNNQINENPLSITVMRNRTYPGSNLTIEKTLSSGSNYNQYIASYKSDGLKIYGLLTIPKGQKPQNGWPVIIFNHGYIQPDLYKTTERYAAYVDEFARNDYIVFKPDYRGNGNSEGQPEGAYYSSAYATDVLNALTTLKNYKDANPEKIGMWGHSMGGNITLRDIVVDTKDIKVAVIWGGVVGSYDDLINNWQRKVKYQPSVRELALRNNYRQKLTDTYGTPTTNPDFWQVVDPTYHLTDITTPVQLHTGGNDEEVPVAFSVSLKDKLEKAGKTVEYYNYPGGDHNISSPNFEPAMKRSLDFFNKYLKGGE